MAQYEVTITELAIPTRDFDAEYPKLNYYEYEIIADSDEEAKEIAKEYHYNKLSARSCGVYESYVSG